MRNSKFPQGDADENLYLNFSGKIQLQHAFRKDSTPLYKPANSCCCKHGTAWCGALYKSKFFPGGYMSIIFIGSVGLLGTFAWLGYTHINVTTVGRM